MTNAFDRPRYPRTLVHDVVHRDEGAFSSHPFLGGLWRTRNDDLVAAFMKAQCRYGDGGDVHHNTITAGPRSMMSIRSHDNGASWAPESLRTIYTTPHNPKLGGGPDVDVAVEDADVLIVSGADPALFLPEAKPWVCVSTNGGESWNVPQPLPLWGLPSLTGHGSSILRPDGLCLLPLTAVMADGWTRRPVVYGSRDGRHWYFLSFITSSIDDGAVEGERVGHPRFGAHRYMYPRLLWLKDGRLLAAIRSQRDPTGLLWTEIYESLDGGRTWGFLSRVNDWGAPGDLTQMQDGRLVCVYGFRIPPFGVRACVSEDDGRHWGPELILRDDGGSWDLGYPRVVEHEPGRLLTLYYMNRRDDPVQANGGVRHVAQTVFSPD